MNLCSSLTLRPIAQVMKRHFDALSVLLNFVAPCPKVFPACLLREACPFSLYLQRLTVTSLRSLPYLPAGF
jgi:hypothetical protein